MTVLVTAASRHGSTTEIAARIAEVLRSRGLLVVELPPDDVLGLSGLDAVVLGSALYTGGWLKEARHFLERFAADLSQRLAWTFSSGPVGAPLFPEENPRRYAELVARANAHENKVFPGRLAWEGLSLGERLALRSVGSPLGDFRDWPAIEAWGQQIADVLVPLDAAGRLPGLQRS
jgi:menaquinone-dependent protoporphyrinogen oxidase